MAYELVLTTNAPDIRNKTTAGQRLTDEIGLQASSLVSELPIAPVFKSFLRAISCWMQNLGVLTIGNRELNLTAALENALTFSDCRFKMEIINGF